MNSNIPDEDEVVSVDDLRAMGVLRAGRQIGLLFSVIGAALLFAVTHRHISDGRAAIAAPAFITIGLAMLLEPRLYVALGRQHRAVPGRFRVSILVILALGFAGGVAFSHWFAAGQHQ